MTRPAPAQHTLAAPARVAGIALRSGRPAVVELRPAAPDHGLVFYRDGVAIPARIDHVVDTTLATTLGVPGRAVSMVEHLCAALHAAGIDNAAIHVHGDELPVLDGSAAPWLSAVRPLAQAARRSPLVVTTPVEVHDDAGGYARLEPAASFELDVTIEFAHPAIGHQRWRGDLADFGAELAWARTFGFLADADRLRAAGLARGASLENTVVYDAEGAMNPGGLRAPDEAVRHKALDAVGDAALLGAPLRGRLVTRRAGHTLHRRLFAALLAEVEASAASAARARPGEFA